MTHFNSNTPNSNMPNSNTPNSNTPNSNTPNSNRPNFDKANGVRDQETAPARRDAFRYGAMLPVAGLMTIGLTLTMAGLIKAEFTPQDKTETATFEINPKVEDIKVTIKETTIEAVKEVVPPPPPPRIEQAQAEQPTVKITSIIGAVPVFKASVIDKKTFEIVVDSTEKPLLRIPPVFPNRFSQGDVSGYCRVQFDVNPEGQPFNVEATFCTNTQLMAPTVKSVQKWNYAPKVSNGQAVTRSGLKTTIRFDLQDERGNILPLPARY